MNDDEDPREEIVALQVRVSELKRQHLDLDAAVAALEGQPGADMIQIMRLKKQKLSLRDQIVLLEDRITPDIIA